MGVNDDLLLTSSERWSSRLHVWASCFAIAAVLATIVFLTDVRRDASPSNTPIEASDPTEPSPSGALALGPARRPHYGLSVIPGGVYSGDELADAVRQDAVVAAHYGTLDASRVRTTVTPAARMAYVSYRRGNDVFWTRKPVRIPAGETLLTDGETEIRARCGNAVSDIAREPVSDVEPFELDAPVTGDSSETGERGGGEPLAAANVPFLLSAQNALLSNDAAVLPDGFQGLMGTPMLMGLLDTSQPNEFSSDPSSSGGGGRILGGIPGIPNPGAGSPPGGGFPPGDNPPPGGGVPPGDDAPPSGGFPPVSETPPGGGSPPGDTEPGDDVVPKDDGPEGDPKEVPTVPEPATPALLGLGATAAAVRRWRKKTN